MNFLIQTGIGIGDTVQLLPMAKAIKINDPSAEIDFIFAGNKKSYEINRQIIQLQNYVDNLYWYSKNTIMHDIKLLFQLKKNNYDIGFLRVENTTGTTSLWQYRIMRWCKCKKIVGCNYEKLDRVVMIPKNTHYLKRDSLMLEAVGIPSILDAKVIDEEKLSHDWFRKLGLPVGRRIISLSTGTNAVKWVENGKTAYYDVKSWPYERWMELAQKLSEFGFIVFLLGGPKERKELENSEVMVPNQNSIFNFIGKTTIQQSLTLLSYSDLAVGAEGGMMHCAAAVGTYTLTLFGGSNRHEYNPGGSRSPVIQLEEICAPCFLTPQMTQCADHKCINGITVNMVLKKIEELMENR